MVSYYDIRAARTAMRMLQTKPLRRRELDIHFSIPKNNPSNKDVNQGTLVVFNLDPSVSNDDLHQIFGAYGHVKEIRETPYKRYHKFVEYYDTRAAEDAQRSLNRYAIAGKRIKIEPSRPGGARRNLMLHLSQDNKQDEHQSFRRQAGSSIGKSSQGNWPQLESSLEHGSLQSVSKSPGFRSPTMSKNLTGLDSILHPQSSTSIRVPLVGRDSDRRSQVDRIFTNGNTNCGAAFLQSLSFPEFNLSPDSRTASSFDASSSNGSGFEALSGSQFFWGSPKHYSELTNFSSLGGQCIGHHLTTNDQCHGFSFTNQGPYFGSSQGHQQHYHDAGSAPSDFPFESYFGFYQEPPGAFMNPSFGGVGYVQNDRNPVMNLSGCGSGSVSGNMPESGSSGFGSISSPGYSHLFLGNDHFSGIKGFTTSGRGKRIESIGNQMDNSKQFQLDLDKIGSGEDTRTTLMIKNIPNKYTSKMLLAAIDENHRGTYDSSICPLTLRINVISVMHSSTCCPH